MLDGSLIKPNHIILDQNLSDPSKMIYGDVNSEAIQWIRANSHRYLGKYTGTGQMTICQLADVNPDGATGAYFYDGVTEVQAPWCGGTDSLCEWWMRLPKFYYHAEEIEPDIWDIGFGQEPEADDWKCWDGNDLIGVFKASTDQRDYPVCRADLTPKGNMSQSDFYNKVRLRGDGYSLVKLKHHSIVAFLFYAMYGNTDSQFICGNGLDRTIDVVGGTCSLGMVDTEYSGEIGSNIVNFWGLEDWWGRCAEWIDNVSSIGGIWSIQDDDVFRQITVMGSGYISSLRVGDFLDAIPDYTEGSTTTGFCDRFYINKNQNILCRGNASSQLDNGIVCIDCTYNNSYTNDSVGSRLAFRGEIIVEDDIQAFRSIPVTNIEVSPVCP